MPRPRASSGHSAPGPERRKGRGPGPGGPVDAQGPGFSITNPALPPARASPPHPSSRPEPPITQSQVVGPPSLGPHPRPGLRLLGQGWLCPGGRGWGRRPWGLTRRLHVVLLDVGHVRVQRAVQVGQDHLPAVVVAQAQQPSRHQAGQQQRAGEGKAERCGQRDTLRTGARRPARHPEGPQGAPHREGPATPCQGRPGGAGPRSCSFPWFPVLTHTLPAGTARVF